RRTILTSLVLFAAASALGAVAPSTVLLTLARCLQGAAAAPAVPSALRLITAVASTEDLQIRRRRHGRGPHELAIHLLGLRPAGSCTGPGGREDGAER
ncbi:MAG: Major Facilitator Superfamily protein, partial [Pseudonocardiales bacterium]|nr:Major Facilitator Superfamily protein [Pseudonocardiales bacterium]